MGRAVFNVDTMILHIPQLDISNIGGNPGESWWLDLKLDILDSSPVFVLDIANAIGGIGGNFENNGMDASLMATFDPQTLILHIPELDLGDGNTYWLDLHLILALDTRLTFALEGYGVNQTQNSSTAPTNNKMVSLSSGMDFSYSFVTEQITNRTEFDENNEQWDILVEPWCVTNPALCGNFVDLGDINMETVNSYPSSGYLSDESGYGNCVEIDANHTYINKNRDGSHTVFRVTRHEKPSDCEHTIEVTYRNFMD